MAGKQKDPSFLLTAVTSFVTTPILRTLKFPAAPVVLALVLGPMVERPLRQSLTISHGDVSIFFTRTISAVLMVVALASLFAPLLRGVMVWRKRVVEIS